MQSTEAQTSFENISPRHVRTPPQRSHPSTHSRYVSCRQMDSSLSIANHPASELFTTVS